MPDPQLIINNIAQSSPWWQAWLPLLGSAILALVTLLGILKTNSTTRASITAADTREQERWRRDRVIDYAADFHDEYSRLVDLCVKGMYDPRSVLEEPPAAEKLHYYMWDFHKLVDIQAKAVDLQVRKLQLVCHEGTSQALSAAHDLVFEFKSTTRNRFLAQDRWDGLQSTSTSDPEEIALSNEVEETRSRSEAVVSSMRAAIPELAELIRADVGISSQPPSTPSSTSDVRLTTPASTARTPHPLRR
ncbi:hypothetical protein ACBG85_17030 [Rhodococcus sp. NyZ502]|uniref:hypothetical protein n=1 Tax=Rhodococcus sp. NyZ502 TaxID=3242855 RepID=UPI003558077C